MATVLVIDSDELICKILTQILRSGAHEVSACAELNAALVLSQTRKPDLFLIDVCLRGTTGKEALTRLTNAFPGIPVLLILGSPDEKALQQCRQAPDCDLLPKPFTARSLLSKVDQMLRTQTTRLYGKTSGYSLNSTRGLIQIEAYLGRDA